MGLSLEKLALLSRQGLTDDGSNWPKWEVHKVFTWRQAFQPKALVHVTHKYKPILGFESFYNDSSLAAVVKRACIRGPLKAPKGATWVEYILTTGGNWRGPIGNFRLTVHPSKEEQASFCWKGNVPKIRGSDWVVEKKNFSPESELDIFFLSALPP